MDGPVYYIGLLYRVVTVRVVNVLGGNCPGGNCPRWEVFWW